MTQNIISSLFWGQKYESSGENAYPDPVKNGPQISANSSIA